MHCKCNIIMVSCDNNKTKYKIYKSYGKIVVSFYLHEIHHNALDEVSHDIHISIQLMSHMYFLS